MIFNPKIPYALYLCGPPGSGKSSFLTFIELLFNVHCQTYEFKGLGGGFAFENLVNKLILICHEIPDHPSQEALNNMKGIITKDRLVARKIYTSKYLEILAGFFIGASNNKWELGDDVVPFFRRMLYIEPSRFQRKLQQNTFKNTLCKNIPAITRYIMNSHFIQFYTYLFHEEISAAIHKDLNQSPIVLWLKNTSDLYFVEGGDCLYKSGEVIVKNENKAKRNVELTGIHEGFLRFASDNYPDRKFSNLSLNCFISLFNETNLNIIRLPILSREYNKYSKTHEFISGILPAGYRNIIFIDRAKTENVNVPSETSFILEKQHTTDHYLSCFEGRRFTRVSNRISILTLLISCIQTPLSETYNVNKEIYLRYRISAGMLLILGNLMLQGAPDWFVEETNQERSVSERQEYSRERDILGDLQPNLWETAKMRDIYHT
jgi:Family of unknown function (DUF5906)